MTEPTGQGRPTIYIGLSPSDAEMPTVYRESLRAFADVVQNPEERRPTDAEKEAGLCGAEGAILGRSGGGLTPELIDRAEQLRIVGVVGGSVRMVAPEHLLDRGIVLVNTGWAMADSVAEFTLALMLCGLRDLPYMVDVMRAEGWGRARAPRDLAGKDVGLVGFGMIGRRVAELLAPFRCTVRVYDPYVRDEDIVVAGAVPSALQELMESSFVVSLHAGSTDESKSLLGPEELALMPDGGLLVNTGRAAVVDEAALVSELGSGRIKAALNVYWKEPLAADHPLRDMDNVILTPHGGGLTRDRQHRFGESIVEDVERFFGGDAPNNLVTREMLARMT